MTALGSVIAFIREVENEDERSECKSKLFRQEDRVMEFPQSPTCQASLGQVFLFLKQAQDE